MEVTSCPQCGAPSRQSQRTCEYCKAEFVVSSLSMLSRFDRNGVDKYLKHFKARVKSAPDDFESIFSLGLCYLQMKLYPFALEQFQKARELSPESAEVYYYLALAMVKGRRLKTLSHNEVREIESYLSMACQLDDAPAKYYYFAGALKFDYYRANGLRMGEPTDTDLIEEGKMKQQDPGETDLLMNSILVRDEGLISAIRA